MAAHNSDPGDDQRCFDSQRSNCSCSNVMATSSNMSDSSEKLIFYFDDISENRKEVVARRKTSNSASSAPSTIPLNSLISQTSSEVFPQDSPSLFQMESVGTQSDSKRSSRGSCKSHAEAIGITVPTCKQRHTNFTPPRNSLSEKSLHLSEDVGVFICSIHSRRSSACPILCRNIIEASVGRDLRSLSDYFNNKCIGLEDGYHLRKHPLAVYNRVYSSSYPGTLSTSTFRSTPVVKGQGTFKGTE